MSPESTDFLYPFIEGDEHDAASLLADLATSAGAKWEQSSRLRVATLELLDPQLREAGAVMARGFEAGGQLFAFGNGGSATDADDVAQLFTSPPWGEPLPARSLVTDHAVLSALSNDVGFDVVFSRQLEAHGRPGDIAFGLSTSGNSENLLRAFAQAAKGGMCTVGLSGSGGGRMATSSDLEHSLVVGSDSVHRIQETQAAVVHALWAAVQAEYRSEVSHDNASHDNASHDNASHDNASHEGAA